MSNPKPKSIACKQIVDDCGCPLKEWVFFNIFFIQLLTNCNPSTYLINLVIIGLFLQFETKFWRVTFFEMTPMQPNKNNLLLGLWNCSDPNWILSISENIAQKLFADLYFTRLEKLFPMASPHVPPKYFWTNFKYLCFNFTFLCFVKVWLIIVWPFWSYCKNSE